MEASRNGKLREKRRECNIDTDPLIYKMQTLEDYNLYIWPHHSRSHEKISDIGKTREVPNDQKKRTKWLTDEAKQMIENKRERK